jgi:3-oxoacyl-[acyl-carrier protein] reductase
VSSDTRIVLVTGAANGIGLAIARSFLDAGHCVAMVDRDGAALDRLVPELPRERALPLTADLRDAGAPRRLADEVAKRWGPVSILVNNAGVPSSKRQGLAAGVLELTDEEWSEVLDINLGAAFRMCRAFLPAMVAQGWGRVINMASLAGRTRSLVASSNYMASKAGLLALTRSIAAEFGPRGITANALAPGLVATPMAAARPPEANAAVVAQIPVRRMGEAREIAAAARYLASEDAGFVNGAVIDLNGGVYMN